MGCFMSLDGKEIKIGSLIENKYKVIAQIGRGGMSTVWLALNEKANKQWAIKEVRKSSRNGSEIIKQNLITETKILTKLNHPNLPSIIDIIDGDNTYLIIMDYVEGRTLKDLVDDKGALPQNDVINYAIQLCSVLEYLHERKPPIIYRDMKPANIMLKPNGEVVLIDFGTAREFKEGQENDTTSLGTRGYAAPEQYGGNGQTDQRTDIYNLGATIYHLVTGKNPAKPPYEMRPIREWDPSLSSGLESIIMKCIETDPNQRYQSAAELKYALEHYVELETQYVNEKRKSFKKFIIMLSLGIVFIGGGLFSRAKAGNLKSGTYNEQIRIAEMSSDKKAKEEAYKQAIIIDPSKKDSYINLLNDVYLSDGVFSQDEANNITSILGYKGSSDDVTISTKFKKNEEGYDEFAYNMGLAYFYYFEEDGSKQLSQNWFDIAKDSKYLNEVQKKRADKFYKISQYYSHMSDFNKAGDNDISYKDFWNDFVMLATGDLAKEDNIRTALVIYRELTAQIGQKSWEFMAAGISYDDLLGELDMIDSKVNNEIVNMNQFNNDIDASIVEDINNNIENARRSLDITFDDRSQQTGK